MKYEREQLESFIAEAHNVMSSESGHRANPEIDSLLKTLHKTVLLIRSCDYDSDSFKEELLNITGINQDTYNHAYTLYQILFTCELIQLPLYINDLLKPIVKWRLLNA